MIAFKCEHCPDRAYAYKQDLLKHLERDHDESTPYQCELCNQSFRRHLELIRHCCEEYKKQSALAEARAEADTELDAM